MPLLRMKEIRDLSSEECKKKVNEFRTELFRLRTMTEAGGAVENPSKIKELKKTIARILTVMSEEETLKIKKKSEGKSK